MLPRAEIPINIPQTYVIPDSVCEKAGLAARWLPGDNLATFASLHTSGHSSDKRTLFAQHPNPSKIYRVRKSILLFDPITRKLINESNGAFLNGQKLLEQENPNENRPQLLKLSRLYRSIIQACLENLQSEVANPECDKKEHYAKLISIFYNIEFLWHIIEILYVDVVPGDIVLPQFLEWIRFHFFHYERQAQAMVEADTCVHSSEEAIDKSKPEEYWDTMIGLVFQGRMDAARALLRINSSYSSNAFQLADNLMKSMPVFTIYGGLSVNEFNRSWQCWHGELAVKLESGIFSSKPELELIMKIMAGDVGAFSQVKHKCRTWYQYMAAWLLYTEPTVKTFDLSYHATKCLPLFGGVDNLREVDHILLSLMDSNLYMVISLINLTTENGWFATHLMSLLNLVGCVSVLDNDQHNVTSILYEELLLEYGSMLMSHPSLWQVGISYLDHCPTQGRACIELLLPSIFPNTDAKARKLIQVAREREMNDIALGIARVMAMKWYKEGRLGSALMWAMRSQDSGLITYLTDTFLKSYSEEGKFESTDIIENLGSTMLLSDRLTFLGKYYEFHQLYQAGAFRDAAVLLCDLIMSRLAPKYFWMTLLTDSIALLECNELVFTSEELHELLACLEELVLKKIIPANTVEEPAEDSKKVLYQKVSLLRYAISRNLSRVFIHEISGSKTTKDNSSIEHPSYAMN